MSVELAEMPDERWLNSPIAERKGPDADLARL